MAKISNHKVLELSKTDLLFIDAYFNNNFNATKSLLEVFPDKGYKSAKYAAYQLLAKPQVKVEVDKRFKEIQDANLLCRDEIILALKDVIASSIEKNDHKTLLKAIDTVNKMMGNYTTLIEASITQNIKLIIPGMDELKDDNE